MKQRIINYLFRNLIGGVTPQDIIRSDKGTLYLGSEPINQMELNALVAEAKTLERMRLWSILNSTAKQKAFERGWTNSTTMEHLNIAKAEYAVLETQASIIKIIKSKSL